MTNNKNQFRSLKLLSVNYNLDMMHKILFTLKSKFKKRIYKINKLSQKLQALTKTLTFHIILK